MTGEGRLDPSSPSGKTTIGVARCCGALPLKCVALVGASEIGFGSAAQAARRDGLTAWFSICNRPITLEQAMNNAPELLANLAGQIIQLFYSAHF